MSVTHIEQKLTHQLSNQGPFFISPTCFVHVTCSSSGDVSKTYNQLPSLTFKKAMAASDTIRHEYVIVRSVR
jgi:hypothetical protein